MLYNKLSAALVVFGCVVFDALASAVIGTLPLKSAASKQAIPDEALQ